VSWYTLVRIAWRRILQGRVRALLASLGVVIAVAATLCGMTLREAAQRRTAADVATVGARLLVLTPGAPPLGPDGVSLVAAAFDDLDLVTLRREIPGIETLAPVMSRLRFVDAGGKAHRTLVVGTTPDYFAIKQHPLAAGRWMTPSELANGRVCVIGQTLRAELFGAGDPIGGSARVGTLSCQIVGLLAPANPTGLADPNDILMLPLATFKSDVVSAQTVSAIYMSVRADHSLVVVKHQVEMLVRERRRLGPDAPPDFELREARDFNPPDSGPSVSPGWMGCAAASGWVLAGLCLMHAMLIRVQESRPLIGLFLALGATRRDVLSQFLIESALLSTLGGLGGIALGLVCSVVGSRLHGLDGGVSGWGVALIAFGSPVLGIVFGAPPAFGAARLEAPDVLHRG
jgi:putative ABC transport system permease protein